MVVRHSPVLESQTRISPARHEETTYWPSKTMHSTSWQHQQHTHCTYSTFHQYNSPATRLTVTVTRVIYTAPYWETTGAWQNNHHSVLRCPQADWNKNVFSCRQKVVIDGFSSVSNLFSARGAATQKTTSLTIHLTLLSSFHRSFLKKVEADSKNASAKALTYAQRDRYPKNIIPPILSIGSTKA